MTMLDELRRATGLHPLDYHLGRVLAARSLGVGDSPETAEDVALTAALVSRAQRHGHVCVALEEVAGTAFPADDVKPGAPSPPMLPELEPWTASLARASLAGDGRTPTPLVLDAAGRCYLYRYWAAERDVAAAADRLRRSTASTLDVKALAPLFAALFPAVGADAEAMLAGRCPRSDDEDRQAVAAAATLRNRLTVISGGPGTGKTTTVARALALAAAARPGLRVRLAAPTGKAAARLSEAIRSQIADLPVSADIRAALPVEAFTIHRLLGFVPDEQRYRARPGHPLHADLVVIDEASMVDLLTMKAVLGALAPTASLVLLGDREQLASVEAGYILGDLCRALDADHAVELTHSWRFQAQAGIGRLAGAIRSGHAGQARAALEEGAFDELDCRPGPDDAAGVAAFVLDHAEALVGSSSVAEALAAMNRLRLLAPGRKGPLGVESLNAAVERALGARGLRRDVGEKSATATAMGTVTGSNPWYRGRPVLITANDYNVGLFNGDTGVCWPADGHLYVWFPGPDGAPRPVSAARLPAHETAWAMTVHKSQGSEFERVVLVLPERDSALVTRELLYTAVTRARSHVTVLGSMGLLEAGVARVSVRASGLAQALAAGSDAG
jgi:exodeoxyribonuclease V alpha subunit